MECINLMSWPSHYNVFKLVSSHENTGLASMLAMYYFPHCIFSHKAYLNSWQFRNVEFISRRIFHLSWH